MDNIRNMLLKFKELLDEYNRIKLPDTNLNTLNDYITTIEKYNEELNDVNEKINNLDISNVEEREKLQALKDKLTKEIEQLKKEYDILKEINELEEKIIKSTTLEIVKDRDTDIIELLESASNNEELAKYIDAICIYYYKVPLLVALISKDPSDIIKDFQLLSLKEDTKNQVIEYIETQKLRIERNLILSDKALIDLVENSIGKNITQEQRRNERLSTRYNEQYNRVILQEQGSQYKLLRDDIGIATSGKQIKRFETLTRRDQDMLVRDFPTADLEDITYRNFKLLPDEMGKKELFIAVIIENIELCYAMFQSYYEFEDYYKELDMDFGRVEIPVLLRLSNGDEMKFMHNFKSNNLPHILGIPSTHEYDKVTEAYTGRPLLSDETLRVLGLEGKHANALTVLKQIIKRKDAIIQSKGLIKDNTGRYYEMLPWEKIILKTNAFIRGDFFKTPSLITPINPNSYLLDPNDNIRRIGITDTRFSSSAINQPSLISTGLVDSDASLEELINNAKNISNSDLVIRGLLTNSIKDGEIWTPKTNLSGIGERINPVNGKILKTLERYKYLLAGIDPSDGGFVTSVQSINNSREYSVDEILTSFVNIANSFNDVTEITLTLKSYLDQIKSLNYTKRMSR